MRDSAEVDAAQPPGGRSSQRRAEAINPPKYASKSASQKDMVLVDLTHAVTEASRMKILVHEQSTSMTNRIYGLNSEIACAKSRHEVLISLLSQSWIGEDMKMEFQAELLTNAVAQKRANGELSEITKSQTVAYPSTLSSVSSPRSNVPSLPGSVGSGHASAVPQSPWSVGSDRASPVPDSVDDNANTAVAGQAKRKSGRQRKL